MRRLPRLSLPTLELARRVGSSMGLQRLLNLSESLGLRHEEAVVCAGDAEVAEAVLVEEAMVYKEVAEAVFVHAGAGEKAAVHAGAEEVAEAVLVHAGDGQ